MVQQLAYLFNLIQEFKNYKWKEDQAGKATNEPIDKFNHGITFGETASLS
jgi:phage terminase large subunit